MGAAGPSRHATWHSLKRSPTFAPARTVTVHVTGSVMDGEDVVRDALFQAYRKLDTFDDKCPLAPWLFELPTIDVSISCVAMRFGRKRRQPPWCRTG